mmetsp:Transcript_6703/g.18935  ORF Transcript_6703/g.18935 Transcript_6703/m.18935 type:complete len:331 (-) Transcript_6703:56-1048(-)
MALLACLLNPLEALLTFLESPMELVVLCKDLLGLLPVPGLEDVSPSVLPPRDSPVLPNALSVWLSVMPPSCLGSPPAVDPNALEPLRLPTERWLPGALADTFALPGGPFASCSGVTPSFCARAAVAACPPWKTAFSTSAAPPLESDRWPPGRFQVSVKFSSSHSSSLSNLCWLFWPQLLSCSNKPVPPRLPSSPRELVPPSTSSSAACRGLGTSRSSASGPGVGRSSTWSSSTQSARVACRTSQPFANQSRRCVSGSSASMRSRSACAASAASVIEDVWPAMGAAPVIDDLWLSRGTEPLFCAAAMLYLNCRPAPLPCRRYCRRRFHCPQ